MIEIAGRAEDIVSYSRMAVPAGEGSITFKSKSLPELDQIASRIQRLIGALCPYGTYVFYAACDDDTGEWSGSFYELL